MYIVGVLAIFFVWLAVLSLLLYNTRRHYLSLVSHTGKQKINEIMDLLVEHDKKLQAESEKIKKELNQVIENSKYYFQKLGLVRYSAFGRSGGNEQSFVLALLDKEDNGIVINFIYAHDGVHIYTKRAKNGKGEEYQLSEEETRAIAASK
ncbi:DUF4446 family protein [Candidatus Roizmanbacteria bacterium]|nr:DUF4446 family protein [Candidatus Roizmanbacteria bacterium]